MGSESTVKLVYQEVQRQKDQAVESLRGDPEQVRRLTRQFYGPVAEELPDAPTGRALVHTLEGVAWVARLLHNAGLSEDEGDALFDVIDEIDRTTTAHIREMGGVMTPVQGVSAGIGAGFFTGLWMGLLLRDEKAGEVTEALRAALDAMVHRPPDSSLFRDAIQKVGKVLHGEDWDGEDWEEPE